MCRKRRYRDEIGAKLALATIARIDRTKQGHEAKECRYYACDACGGYHLTSQKNPPKNNRKQKTHAGRR